MATWVLTGSPENYEATAAHGHSLRPGTPGEADANVLLEAMRERSATGVGR